MNATTLKLVHITMKITKLLFLVAKLMVFSLQDKIDKTILTVDEYDFIFANHWSTILVN